ncbi:uncharacterized protein LOC132665033 [Panthera onca]
MERCQLAGGASLAAVGGGLRIPLPWSKPCPLLIRPLSSSCPLPSPGGPLAVEACPRGRARVSADGARAGPCLRRVPGGSTGQPGLRTGGAPAATSGSASPPRTLAHRQPAIRAALKGPRRCDVSRSAPCSHCGTRMSKAHRENVSEQW